MKRGYDTAPWNRLAHDVRVDHIPGQHNTCITTYVDALAERLNEVLAEPTAEQGAVEGALKMQKPTPDDAIVIRPPEKDAA
jgi:hypothetical protein